MKKNQLHLIIILLLGISIFLTACSSIHIPIKEEDVSEVIVYDSMYNYGGEYHTMSQSEISDLVKWFNACTDIRLNSDFAGTVTIVGITIKMKDDRNISIVDSGENFEIQISDPKKETISYWAKQPDIEALLKTLDKPVKNE